MTTINTIQQKLYKAKSRDVEAIISSMQMQRILNQQVLYCLLNIAFLDFYYSYYGIEVVDAQFF